MGVSTDGLLIYGYPLDNVDDYDDLPDWFTEHNYPEWEEATFRKLGFNREDYDYEFVDNPDWSFRKYRPGVRQFIPTDENEYERYRKDREAVQKQAKKRFGIDGIDGVGIRATCSDEYPVWYVKAKCIRASRGRGVKLDLVKDFWVSPVKVAKLHRWIDFMDLPYKAAEEGWWLESYWG